jgi:hypothetical protein
MLSVDPAADDRRMSDHYRATTCRDTASPNHSTRTDYCARFRSTQGDDASQQQQRNDRVLHCYSPGASARCTVDSSSRHIDMRSTKIRPWCITESRDRDYRSCLNWSAANAPNAPSQDLHNRPAGTVGGKGAKPQPVKDGRKRPDGPRRQSSPLNRVGYSA